MSCSDSAIFDHDLFYQQLIRPVTFNSKQLLTNQNQVAGHARFYSIQGEPNLCLKPFNTNCVRGRREHLFYQIIEYLADRRGKKFKEESLSTSEKATTKQHHQQPTSKSKLYYKHFNLLTYPSPATKCNCIIDEALLDSLSSFVANFYHVKHLFDHHSLVDGDKDSNIITTTSDDDDDKDLMQFQKSVYSEILTCPCYGRDAKEKSSCSRDYEKVNFLCLQDLTAHCQEPCIIDIKIGQITYDPMAIKEKVLEQSSKYQRLREFGFRILGMKLGAEIKGKAFGKTLETTEQVFEALNSFFIPLNENIYKCSVINRILERLNSLLEWFENKNINQLKFFSSSLLIVYDLKLINHHNEQQPKSVVLEDLANSVRVSMIDLAHVFHIHDSSLIDINQTKIKDDNYIFGLKKLSEFLFKINTTLNNTSVEEKLS